ncbi:MAG: TIR domain-containing protein [Pseudonocardiaceae bacterium]
MSGIFINYRQNYYPNRDNNDAERRAHVQVVEAIAERLARHFGPNAVFLDTGLRLGGRYPDELRAKLHRSDLVIAVIHEEWLADLKDRENRLRLRPNEKDWVRYELETTFAGSTHVLPVLIDKARLPGQKELPDSIDGLGLCQAHRIQFGHWQFDVIRLIEAVELYVPPTAVLQEGEEPVRPQRRWWYRLAVAGVLGLLTPYAAIRLLIDSPATQWVWLAALAAALLFGLVLVLAMTGVMYAIRERLDVLDFEAAAMSHDLKTNVIAGLTIAGLATIVIFTSNLFTPLMQLFQLAVIVGIVITLGVPWLHNQRTAGQWPVPWLDVHPAAIRGALARVDRHLTECAPLMTRLQRDQARFALDQVCRTAARLGELCKIDRRSWLRAASPWLTFTHIVLFAAAAGAAMAAVIVYWVSGGSHWQSLAWSGGCLVLAFGCYLATIDRSYRLERWRRQVVVKATPKALDGLEARLLEISIPPAREGPAREGPAKEGSAP